MSGHSNKKAADQVNAPTAHVAPVTHQKTLLTVNQAAEFLQVSFWTLLQWRKRAKGPPYIRVGHFIRYVESDLMDWLQSNRVSPTLQRGRASVMYK